MTGGIGSGHGTTGSPPTRRAPRRGLVPKVLGAASVVVGVVVLLLGGVYTLGALSTHNQANPLVQLGLAIGLGMDGTGLVLLVVGLVLLRLGRRRSRRLR